MTGGGEGKRGRTAGVRPGGFTRRRESVPNRGNLACLPRRRAKAGGMNCEEGQERQRVNMSQGARVRRRRIEEKGKRTWWVRRAEGVPQIRGDSPPQQGGREKEVGYEGARKGSVDDLLSVVIIQTPMLDLTCNLLIDRLGCSERSGSNIMLLM